MRLWCALLISVLAAPLTADAQQADTILPVFDIHFHAPLRPGSVEQTMAELESRLALMDSLNVRGALLTGVPDVLFAWSGQHRDRLIPALLFPCENGIAPNWGRPCFPGGRVFPDTAWLRQEILSKRIAALGEITTQYLGMTPQDPRLEPYLSLAEELDIPVAIHMGLGPPGAAYEVSPADVKSPNFRATAGDPLLLEEVLLHHRRLRVIVMHAGWPMASEMIYLLYQHPQVYVDVAVLQWAIPRAEYYSYLRRLVEAGYGERIMFGSDGGASALRDGITAILNADFLTERQKRDILHNNAARFLRLGQPRGVSPMSATFCFQTGSNGA